MAGLKDTYEAGGFLFETKEEAELAERELEGIRYIKTKTDMENPEMVFQVYDNLVTQKLFETPVGYCFLNELREYLLRIPAIQNSDIKDIPIIRKKEEKKSKAGNEEPKKKKAEKPKKERQERNVDYKSRCRLFMTTTLILAISVITMMFLASTADNVNILNYENKLIDKYSAWEQELEEREAAVKELEQQ